MTNILDVKNISIDELVGSQKYFADFVYTSMSEAKNEIQKRWNNRDLEKEINDLLLNDIPLPLYSGYKAVLFRQLFTPNHELRHFIDLLKDFGTEPMFLEYFDDKFTSNNPLKHALGRMKFQDKIIRGNKVNIEKNIIKFNESDGKKIKEVKTIWGQSLIDFHHELLASQFPKFCKYSFDTSGWFHRGGGNAKEYYERYITLFIRNGILFENFILEGRELGFVKDVFLPAFIEIWSRTKIKPLIVALLPLETQNDDFWISHPVRTLDYIKDKFMI